MLRHVLEQSLDVDFDPSRFDRVGIYGLLDQELDRIATSSSAKSRRALLLVAVEGVVEAIDRDQRKLTLKNESGNQVQLTVSDQAQRFDEVDLGDTVVLEYWTFLKAEFRNPTEEERQNPIAVLAAAGKAPADVD